jgi:hypothetical protein
MNDDRLITPEYRDWLKAAVQENTALLTFYWELGADIVERQKTAKWGSGFLKQLSADLMAEFPDMKGFSYCNLVYIKTGISFMRWDLRIVPQAVAQLGNSLLTN